MTKKLTTEQQLKEFEELQALIKDVLSLQKQLEDGGAWTNATREEAQFFIDSVNLLNDRARSYIEKVEIRGRDFLADIDKELPLEPTLWDDLKKEMAPLKKLGDAVAKFFGQDSMADVADTYAALRGSDVVVREQPLSEKYGEKVQELEGVISKMKEELQKKEVELNEELTKIEDQLLLTSLEHKIQRKEKELGVDFKFQKEGQDLYEAYYQTLFNIHKGNIVEERRIELEYQAYKEDLRSKVLEEEENQYEEEKALLEKNTLENEAAQRSEAERQKALVKEKTERDQKLFEEEIANRIEAGKQFGNIEAQNADEILEAKTSATLELKGADDILAQNNKKLAESEKENQKTRLDQWKDYAQKAAEISQKISEATSMVTNSLGGMFGQLGSYYADQVQAFADKIAVLDEEKEAALERVALSEEERQEKENEIALQRIELEYTTSEEQRTKADERIATLQGELSAEDTINREFGDKKAELEKEKAKKEAEQKKAEKMEKRLQMSQSIVEAIGNVAAGAAKGLSYGPILGPIMAAIVTAAGAVQVGIMTKQLTKMKDGGLLHGFSHSQGGMRIMGSNVEVEGGEYVVNKQSTRKNLGLLEYINGERRGLGYGDMNTFFGQNSTTPSFLTQMMNEPSGVPQLPMRDSVDTQILNAIEHINFQPRVSVTDINTVHESMVKVDEWTGM